MINLYINSEANDNVQTGTELIIRWQSDKSSTHIHIPGRKEGIKEIVTIIMPYYF